MACQRSNSYARSLGVMTLFLLLNSKLKDGVDVGCSGKEGRPDLLKLLKDVSVDVDLGPCGVCHPKEMFWTFLLYNMFNRNT